MNKILVAAQQLHQLVLFGAAVITYVFIELPSLT
jgi:hypothetical protein